MLQEPGAIRNQLDETPIDLLDGLDDHVASLPHCRENSPERTQSLLCEAGIVMAFAQFFQLKRLVDDAPFSVSNAPVGFSQVPQLCFRSMSPAQPALYLLAAVSDLLYCLFDSRFGPAGFLRLVANFVFLSACHARTILIATARRLLPRIFCHRPPPLASPNARQENAVPRCLSTGT